MVSCTCPRSPSDDLQTISNCPSGIGSASGTGSTADGCRMYRYCRTSDGARKPSVPAAPSPAAAPSGGGTAAPVAQLVGAWVNGAASAKVTDSRNAGVCRLDCTETSSTSEPTDGPCATARVSCLTEKPGFTWNLKNCRKARFSPSARPVQEQSES